MKGLIYIHGKGGNAKEAQHYVPLFEGYDVIGLDYQSQTPWDAREEFTSFFDSFRKDHDPVVVIANSIGAYFSMHSLYDREVEKAYFISPIADMEALIFDMMKWAGVSEEELRTRKEIETDFGEKLSWETLCWVRDHPIEWESSTRILYGERDNLQSSDSIRSFAERIGADLKVMKGGEHWFHTNEQMDFLDRWITGQR